MSTKISALPAASAAAGTETLPVVQGGATKKMTLAQVLTYVQAALASVFATAAQGAKADTALQPTTDFSTLGNYVDDAAAAAGSVPVGGLYRNGSVVMVRVS